MPTWFHDLVPKDCSEMVELSGKIMFLLELIKEVEKVGEKILVFSQSLLVLDLIEEMLQLPESGGMVEDIHYFRLDGSTKVDDRRCLMNKFNKKAHQTDKLVNNNNTWWYSGTSLLWRTPLGHVIVSWIKEVSSFQRRVVL